MRLTMHGDLFEISLVFVSEFSCQVDSVFSHIGNLEKSLCGVSLYLGDGNSTSAM